MEATLDRAGYSIHYQAIGAGPRVVWVDPALGSSAMRPLEDAIDELARRFEVVTYDRRGRGRNEPTANLSVGDEVEDLLALVTEVGGAAMVLGFSSGGALVLHAAPRLDTHAVVLLEPAVDAKPDESGLRERVADALARGDDSAAVLAFYDALGVPEEIVQEQVSSSAWPHVVNSAATLLTDIDLAVVDDDAIAAIGLPTHVIVSAGSPDEISAMAHELAVRLRARLWREPGGWHGVDARALAERLAALQGS
jgi:pimeloyl-ACP methyl ester carboxylesterase